MCFIDKSDGESWYAPVHSTSPFPAFLPSPLSFLSFLFFPRREHAPPERPEPMSGMGPRHVFVACRKAVLRKTTLSSTSSRSKKFPLAEGIGIFVGILAWDLLSEGRPKLLKALLIAGPCALGWYAIRCWRRRHGAGKLRH